MFFYVIFSFLVIFLPALLIIYTFSGVTHVVIEGIKFTTNITLHQTKGPNMVKIWSLQLIFLIQKAGHLKFKNFYVIIVTSDFFCLNVQKHFKQNLYQTSINITSIKAKLWLKYIVTKLPKKICIIVQTQRRCKTILR